MSSFKECCRLCLVMSIGFAWVVSLSGCGVRTTPPGPTSLGTSVPGMTITFLRWKQGLTVLFVDDVKGGHGSAGSGSTDDTMHTSTVSAGDPDSGGYKCLLETKDGISAICRINGKEYDLANGTLFVIKSKGEQVEVRQLKRDLTKIPFDAADCRAPIGQDAEIRKLLELGDLPK